MTGGTGSDLYFVDEAGGRVLEMPGEGTDTVYTKVSYTLGADDQIEVLWANAGTTGLMPGGNGFDNRLVGRAGADTLAGVAPNDGSDALDGGAGNPLEGGAGEDNYGRGGADTLEGGAGNDGLEGGAGADSFLFDTPFIGVTNIDAVADFEVGTDTIRLDSTCFTGLSLGHLRASRWRRFRRGDHLCDGDRRSPSDRGQLHRRRLEHISSRRKHSHWTAGLWPEQSRRLQARLRSLNCSALEVERAGCAECAGRPARSRRWKSSAMKA